MKTPEPDKVIDIGDLSLWRNRQDVIARKYQPGTGCLHKNLLSDDVGEILTCKDCGRQVSAYWALKQFSHQYRDYVDSLKARAEQVRIREEKGLILKAAQEIESAWRSRTMVPACPHCQKAIMPGDRFGGLMYNKEDPDGAEKSYKKTAIVLGLK